jgi:hypothetical protein
MASNPSMGAGGVIVKHPVSVFKCFVEVFYVAAYSSRDNPMTDTHPWKDVVPMVRHQ